MVQCRLFEMDDYQFLRKMLFEAVFWSRLEEDKPELEEGLSYDYTKHVLVDFGKRPGDLAVIAEVDGKRAGAAFIRYWNQEENIRGYMSDEIPVLVIAVSSQFRRQGIGEKLIDAIKEAAMDREIMKISLCVTKSNIAYNLYVKKDFQIVEDLDDSFNMVWKASE